MLEYRFWEDRSKYEDSSILPLIRWWIAYRLYCDKIIELLQCIWNQIFEPEIITILTVYCCSTH